MIYSKFSELLGRKQLKLSRVIAETGISRPTLTSLYYNNGRGINFDTLDKLCRVLRVDISDILEFIDIDINIDTNNIWIKTLEMDKDPFIGSIFILTSGLLSSTIELNVQEVNYGFGTSVILKIEKDSIKDYEKLLKISKYIEDYIYIQLGNAIEEKLVEFAHNKGVKYTYTDGFAFDIS